MIISASMNPLFVNTPFTSPPAIFIALTSVSVRSLTELSIAFSTTAITASKGSITPVVGAYTAPSTSGFKIGSIFKSSSRGTILTLGMPLRFARSIYFLALLSSSPKNSMSSPGHLTGISNSLAQVLHKMFPSLHSFALSGCLSGSSSCPGWITELFALLDPQPTSNSRSIRVTEKFSYMLRTLAIQDPIIPDPIIATLNLIRSSPPHSHKPMEPPSPIQEPF